MDYNTASMEPKVEGMDSRPLAVGRRRTWDQLRARQETDAVFYLSFFDFGTKPIVFTHTQKKKDFYIRLDLIFLLVE